MAFDEFEVADLPGAGVTLRVRHRRHPDRLAPAVLLVHGFPQTSFTWHRLVASLTPHYSIVCPDLRGYGSSGKPAGLRDHSNYSKRTMAADLVAVMDGLGYDAFHLVGHDRGGRVAHRLTVDHPARVTSLAVVDIAPTLAMYEGTTMAFAQSYFHWFFLIQASPLPELLMGARPVETLHAFLGLPSASGKPESIYDPQALAEYESAWSDPGTLHGNCEDYRASASIDLEHDRQDVAKGNRIVCPVLAVWGARGVIQRLFDPLQDWQARSRLPVSGAAVDAGHFIPEEAPAALLLHLLAFWQQVDGGPGGS